MTDKHELYFKAAQSAKIGIWELNFETKVIYWDIVTKNIYEVNPEFIPDFENAMNFYVEGDNRDKIKYFVERACKKGLPFEEQFQILTAKKNVKHIRSIGYVKYENGKPSILFGTFHDITKEQNLIKKLQLSFEKFSSVFSSANDSIIIIDSSTSFITDCNPRTYELTQYEHKELIGLHNSVLFPEETRKEVRYFLSNQLKEDNYFVKETYIQAKNGTIIPVEVASGKKFEVKENIYLVCFIRDISKRKNTEENLSMLSLVASETTDTILIANAEGLTIWANEAYKKLTGLSSEEIIGRKPGYLSKGPETDVETTNRMREAIKNKEGISLSILNYNRKREKYWFELNITPVFDKHGNCTKFVGVGRDITAKKEKELELNRILEVTSQQNNKLFNFAHIVSHNIRSHTSNLAMVLDIMESTEDKDEKLSFVEMLKEGTDKLLETIEYLNEIITIQENTNIKKEKIGLKEEIEKTKNSLSPKIFKSQLKIIHSIPEELTVNAVPQYLDSILLNLFTNAIKYRSKDREAILEIDYEIDTDYTIINFKDNGLGINLNKNRHKIFGMYKTFHGNEDARGIGLFIIKNQIEAMNGKIEVESEEGKGSLFKIYLNHK